MHFCFTIMLYFYSQYKNDLAKHEADLKKKEKRKKKKEKKKRGPKLSGRTEL